MLIARLQQLRKMLWGRFEQKWTKAEVADLIERFVDGRTGPYDWDDFESVPITNPDLDAVRIECLEIHHKYPPGEAGGYCNEAGRAELRRIAAQLREAAS